MTLSDHAIPLAVVGCGARAGITAHALAGGRAQVVAYVDPAPGAAQRLAQRIGAPAPEFSSVTELLGSAAAPEAALVLSPDDTHAQVATQLLEAGVAVYVEKPMTISTEDADAVLLTAARTGTPLYVGHNMRHMAVVRTMREIIARGEIGQVKAIWCRHFVGHGGDFYFKDWHADRSRSTGLLLQKGAHDLDVIHHLAGGYSTRVVGMGGLTLYDQISDRRDNSDRTMPDWFDRDGWPPLSLRELNPVIDVEDLSMVQMRLDNGVLASYQQCHYTPDYWRNYTVIGTEGRIENFGDGAGGVVRLWDHRCEYQAAGDREFPITGESAGHGDADQDTMTEFLDHLAHGSRTITSPVAARQAVATAVAATQSLRDGSQPRDVPALPQHVVAHFGARS
ncbi:Gfo/Idh/MocA family protein [Ruania albidiflava]|uniref:Gfo/Idh/MocA family protein n=1 Tax=Ruania albidiflava TaxID=366586 RepID=UPI0003B7383F|nr:Gfo/Idh/MocA family oxidoreductase [Ruania albidiflava]